MQLNFEQLIIPPGHQLLIKAISWSMYESILDTLGEHRGTRIHYSQGWLEIMTPLPEHEDDKVIISNLIEIILEELDIEFRNLGSTTFKNEAMAQGLEPDICFYIQPQLPLIEIIPHYLEQSKQIGRNKTMKAFRDWVKIQLNRRT